MLEAAVILLKGFFVFFCFFVFPPSSYHVCVACVFFVGVLYQAEGFYSPAADLTVQSQWAVVAQSGLR